jgi:outer membrane immunogenic protein
MKRLLLASTVLALSGQILGDQALAAAPGFSWTGCYIGGNIGTGWNRNRISEPTNPSFQTFAPVDASIDVNDGAGFLGGAQIGCDYQFANSWVVGVQGDVSAGDLFSKANDPFFGGKFGNPITLHAKTDWTVSTTARIGYTWDRVLVYGTVGPAWAHTKYSIQNLEFFGNPVLQFCPPPGGAACNVDGSDTRVGWTVGMGFEWAFMNHWSTGLAYNHFDFGSRTVTMSGTNGSVTPTISGPIDVKQRIDTVKLSITYRFGMPAR